MKNSHNTILLVLIAILLVPVAASAIIFPHDNTYGYRCTVCHNAHSTLGTTGFNNICTSCHNPNDPLGGKKPFYQTDAANPYGTIQNGYSGNITPTRIYQTSHNWAGPDTNPAAGASPPTAGAMNTTSTIKGLLLCVRCHSVHGEYSSAANSPPFLRGRNDRDQLCLDCHKVRSTTTHMTGSHPININYSTALKQHPDKFKPNPENANPDNESSKMKLYDGTLLCSSCHGIHYTDSSSGTNDGIATYNQLSTSRGHLLRTNARGKTAEDINICTNCHAGKKSHNGTGQNIQCNDCHSGHVEYDPDAVAGTEEMNPNLYILRRFMIVSTASGKYTRIRTFYRYTGARKEFYRGPVPADGALGVCQACHYDKDTFKSGHYVDPLHPELGIKPDRMNCDSCHNHVGNFGCSSCHGFPPKINARGTDGYAVWSTATNQADRVYPVDESRTPHATHADGILYKIACSECHKGNTAHNTGNFQQVFLDDNVIAGASATYNTGPRTCSSTYCHSNARGASVTVGWENTKDTIVKGSNRCQACHSDKANPSLLSVTHIRHANYTSVNYSCQNCHAKTLQAYAFANNTGLIYPASKHVNGTKDVSYSFTGTGLQNLVTDSILPYNNTTSKCNTIYCHSNGAGQSSKVEPDWNNPETGKCGSCHGVRGPETFYTYGMIGSGSHFAHLSSSYGPRIIGGENACLKCHSSFSISGGETKHVDGYFKADQSAGNTCYKCHGGWQQGAMSSAQGRGNLNWTIGTRVACTQCHPTGVSPVLGLYSAARYGNQLAPSQINYSTTGHGKSAYKNNDNLKIVCADCHNKNSAHIRPNENSSHSSRLQNFSSLVQGYSNYTGQRSRSNKVCNSCHWEGKSASNKVRFTHVTSVGEARNGTPTMACSRCHNVHGTSNFGMLNDTITFKPFSTVTIVYQSPYSSSGSTRVQKNGPFNFIQTTAPYRGICQVCHTNTIHFKRGVDEAVDGPASGSNANFNGSFANHRAFDANTNCLSCHPHNPPPDSPATFAFYPYGQCNACHGYPPVPKSHNIVQNNYSSGKFEDYTGGGGAHIVAGHVPASANPSQGWSLCTSCHKESDHLTVPAYEQVKVSINPNLQFSLDQTIQTKYTSNRKGGALHETGTCSNVSCHFQKTPAWGNPSMP